MRQWNDNGRTNGGRVWKKKRWSKAILSNSNNLARERLEVREMAKICDGKVIDLIASGYNKEVLPYGWLALISGLAGIKIIVEEPEPIPQRFKEDSSLVETKKVIEKVKKYHQYYWRCFN